MSVKGLYIWAWTALNHQSSCSPKPAFLTSVPTACQLLLAHFTPLSIYLLLFPTANWPLCPHKPVYQSPLLNFSFYCQVSTANHNHVLECRSECQSSLQLCLLSSWYWQRNATISFIFLHLCFENLFPPTSVANLCFCTLPLGGALNSQQQSEGDGATAGSVD